jgi:hypothetical protein
LTNFKYICVVVNIEEIGWGSTSLNDIAVTVVASRVDSKSIVWDIDLSLGVGKDLLLDSVAIQTSELCLNGHFVESLFCNGNVVATSDGKGRHGILTRRSENSIDSVKFA